jgi:AcrR family transcriptional regulator
MDALTEKSASGRRYRGISNEARKAERHQKFLQAGLHCFAHDGYHQSTVRGICAAAGLTERYFYESFSGMAMLFREVYLDVSARVRGRVLSVVADVPADDLNRFSRTALRAFFQSIQEQPVFVPILFQEALSVSADMTRLALSTLNEFVELLITIGQPSFVRKTDLTIDPGLVSAGLVGGIMHMAVRWAQDSFRLSLDDVVDNAMLIFAGLLASNPT